MSTIQLKVIITVFIFLIIFFSGLWLNKTGKPYNIIVLAIHKLISAGIIIYIAVTCYQLYKAAGLNTSELILGSSMIIVFLGSVVSGALLSAGNPMPSTAAIIHKALSYVSVLFTGILIYFLRARL